MTHPTSPKIIVGLSGGVDSSLSAARLQDAGYIVEGLFMKNWEEDDNTQYCSSEKDLKDAKAICDKLKIPLHTVNFAAEYWDHVFEHFLKEYRAGRTPNPDILCNKEIKFHLFLNYAKKLGADFIATGHYVRKNQNTAGQWQLLRGIDPNKDQSYFLYTLNQSQLSASLFPVGDLHKPDVRRLALEKGLATHNKKDSTGICFIGERKFKTFLSEYLAPKPGKIQDTQGVCVGEHDGLMYYTRGQRKGLQIGGLKNRDNAPWFVVEKNLEENVLIVAQGHDHPQLFNKTLFTIDTHWITQTPAFPLICTAKTRYRQTDSACTVHGVDLEKGACRVDFHAPEWAITPGQAIVFYQDDVCLGGATIEKYE